MKRKRDKYDREITVLKARPELISSHWQSCNGLFAVCGKEIPGQILLDKNGSVCGCLTEVRSGCPAQTPELTKAIRADKRIPLRSRDIKAKHLPVFAMWQRRLDRTIRKAS